MQIHEKKLEQLRLQLNQETSRMPWSELLRHFAGGHVLIVDGKLDLIEVAARMAGDDTESVSRWLCEGSLAKMSDAQAQQWLDEEAMPWAVVVKPWILIQKRVGN
ncbi:MAG: hypothetical protein K0S28_968 [Paucimonas sp.]|jgi:hypothetical protein|nr:hypothetical protein [Paucimonas sp.]